MVPSAATARWTTDSDKSLGGEVPLPTGGVTPLPLAMNMPDEPSETMPPPDCQMPAPDPLAAASSVHRCVDFVLVFTPTT